MIDENSLLADALRFVRPMMARHSMRLLDFLYGPRMAQVRAMAASMILEKKLSKSAKEVQWGNFRAMLMSVAGVDTAGKCIAQYESEFHAAVDQFFADESQGRCRREEDSEKAKAMDGGF